MPFTSDIKKSNIKENWLFELEYFNGDSNGNGSGGFDKVFQADGTTLNLTREALDDSETGIDVDDETVFEVGDFIKVDDALYNLLIHIFNLDLEDEENLSKYHQFRNDVVD